MDGGVDPRRPALSGSRTGTESITRTRRELLGALAVSIVAALTIAVFWLISRNAPRAGRDPNLTPPAYVPTRTAPTATPNEK
ncbi:MAG: hypothetical protein M3Q50_00255 [Chloroflexota bacterium]|nr:hypothetical protein [Chloroflexota bacterium]